MCLCRNAIDHVFQAVHRNDPDPDPDPEMLAYQYLQTLPQLAQGPGDTFFVIPSEVTSALHNVSRAFAESLPSVPATDTAPDESAARADARQAADAVTDAAASTP